MIVNCKATFQQELDNQFRKGSELFSGLIYYFQDISFGEGLKEAHFTMLAGTPYFLQYYGRGTNFKKRSKRFITLFEIDLSTLLNLRSDEELLLFLVDELVEAADKIREFNIKDFRFDEFRSHMVNYLNESVPIVLSGKSPSEGKVLNREIQEREMKMFKKV